VADRGHASVAVLWRPRKGVVDGQLLSVGADLSDPGPQESTPRTCGARGQQLSETIDEQSHRGLVETERLCSFGASPVERVKPGRSL
jgi:hypothetical protein